MNRFLARRLELSLSQADLADKAGVGRDVVARAEGGGMIQALSAHLLAAAMGRRITSLFRFEGARCSAIVDEPAVEGVP